MKDYFAGKAKNYEENAARVNNVHTIADAILEKLTYEKHITHLMDFGSGTGLLTSQIAPYVRKITTVDISASMNEALKAKLPTLLCEISM